MVTHTLTAEAPGSREPWTRLWTWQSLRYRGSGWWLDRMLPHSPAAFLVAVVALPLVWFGCGIALADDAEAYLSSLEVVSQLWFLPLHLICVRAIGGLWAAGLEPSLEGLAFDAAAKRRIRRGALGGWASVGAIGIAAFFIVRDTWFGLTPDAMTGLIPFDDPDRWNLAALGRDVHVMLLGLWHVEWLLFGSILWLQVWTLCAWTRQLLRMDFRPYLTRILVGNGYRHAFTLFSPFSRRRRRACHRRADAADDGRTASGAIDGAWVANSWPQQVHGVWISS